MAGKIFGFRCIEFEYILSVFGKFCGGKNLDLLVDK